MASSTPASAPSDIEAHDFHRQGCTDDDQQRCGGETCDRRTARQAWCRPNQSRLTTMTNAIAATPFAARIQPLGWPVLSGPKQRQQRDHGNHGDILKQQVANARRPLGCWWSRSPSHARTMAVEDIASPSPTTIAACPTD
jgi:hypothetical protein